MKILHVVPGLEEKANGIAVAAKLIAARQGADLVDAADFARGEGTVAAYDEVWVHSMWLPIVLRACFRVLKAGVSLVRMTHANLDPVRLGFHGWRKRLVSPIERWLFKRTARIVVTGPWEAAWCRAWGLENEIETVDLKACFRLEGVKNAMWDCGISRLGKCENEKVGQGADKAGSLHLLYLGRRHPLKGVEYLERAVARLRLIDLRCVSDAFGAELEKVWDWCDVLVLPTLSENFGLVVAEALERGKRVIVTDGAPAWALEGEMWNCGNMGVGKCGNGDVRGERQLVYVRGFRDGTDEERVKLLVGALGCLDRRVD